MFYFIAVHGKNVWNSCPLSVVKDFPLSSVYVIFLLSSPYLVWASNDLWFFCIFQFSDCNLKVLNLAKS